MRARLLPILFSIFLLVNCSTEEENASSLIGLIPENTLLAFKIQDFDTFKSDVLDNDIINKFRSSETVKEIEERLQSLKYIESQEEGFLAILDNPTDSFDFIYLSSDSLPIVYIDSSLNKTVESFKKSDLEFTKYSVGKDTFYSSVIKKKQVVSSSQVQIENLVLEQKNETRLKHQFEKFNTISTQGKSGQIWIDVKNSGNLFRKLFKVDSIANFNYTDWLSLDLSLNNDALVLNGVSIPSDSSQTYLNLFSGTRPLANQTALFASENTNSFTSYTFNNYRILRKQQQDRELVSKDSLFSAVEEIGVSQMDTDKLVLVKTFGPANIADYLDDIRTNSIEFQGSEILELKKDTLLKESFFPIINDFNPNYSTIVENTFAFSTEQGTLENFISSIKLGRTFDKTLIYQNTKDLTTSESTIFSVANYKGFENSLEKTGLKPLADIIQNADFEEYLFGFQVIADRGFFHTNYFIKKNAEAGSIKGVTEEFKTPLDSDVYLNPQFFSNHRTNRKDIVVQDQDNVLYLITNKGKIIWKKELGSPIQGKIHEVDIYRNGKYQLAFTTNNRFFIIDRNGKEVAPFSFKYDGGNLNPLAVFDYSGNKNYRFVVTQGENVRMYNNDGKIVSGFKYTKAEDNIVGAPQHFVIGTRDYLVFRLGNGNLKILNRVGDVRVKVPENISFSDNEIKVHQNKFIVTSQDGILFEIDTQGKIKKSDLTLNADHGFDATSRTLVLMNDNILSIRGKKITLELGVYTKPTIFYLNDKIYVSVTDIQNLKTYLFDSQAEPINGFPVFGASTIDMADMDNDNKPELVLKDQENSIIVYNIN